MLKILGVSVLLGMLLLSVIASSVAYGAIGNRYNLTLQVDGENYLHGEKMKFMGAIAPLREGIPVVIEIFDPSGKVYFSDKVMPSTDSEDIGTYSYEFKIDDEAPAGVWTVTASYASQYMLYAKSSESFRVSDSINILVSPSLKVNVDGSIDSASGEWAHKYDLKYWRPFQHDPNLVEGNIEFNAYYSKGVLYAVFDVPDKKYESKDFVELGIDVSNKGEKSRVGDDVYIFRIYRDGTYESFKLGTERLEGAFNHPFKARAEEAGEIRVQVFDQEGKVLTILDSLRDSSSSSYKGVLGIAGLEVDSNGDIYTLDSDSGVITKFDSQGNLLGSFGGLGTDPKEFIDPTGMAVDADGNLYVADTGNARVQKFDRYGKFLGSFGSMGLLSVGTLDAGYDSEQSKRHELFESPEEIVIGSSGNVYVVDRRTGNIDVFESNGDHIKSFGGLVSPRGIDADSQGNIYVVEGGKNRIAKFDQNGNLLTTWGSFGDEDGMFKGPYGIAVDSGNNVYVSDGINNRIQQFDANGKFLAKWGERGTGSGQFNGAHDMVFDSSNSLYIIDSRNYRIQKLTADGKFLDEFGSKGSGPGQFMTPESITLDSGGNVYVTDVYSKTIQKFDKDGAFVMKWGSPGDGAGEFRGPYGIAVDELDNVYVTDPFSKRVQKFDAKGELLLRWGSSEIRDEVIVDDLPKGDHYIVLDTDSHEPLGIVDQKIVEEQGNRSYFMESGRIWKILHIFQNTIYVKAVSYVRDSKVIPTWTPDGIDVDQYGNVYIVDRENEIAKKFGKEGQLISKWGSTGTGDGQFVKPTAMDIDSENNLYIVDTGNNRIQKFDTDGNFILKWGSYGKGKGQFDNARGIAIDADDNVYVLDNGNNRIQKFDKNGNFIKEWGSKGASAGQFENLSTEGIAADLQGRIYVADLPGESKVTHWVAEVAIPLAIKGDAFGIYLAEGTYGEHKALDGTNPQSVDIYEVNRNIWPNNAMSVFPGTWAKAKLTNADSIGIEPVLSIDNIRSCTYEICSDLNGADAPVPAGNNIIVSVSLTASEASNAFGYDRSEVKLQYSYDGKSWNDADSKFAVISKDAPAAVNLKWTPKISGDVKLRVTSSGVLTGQSTLDLKSLKVEETESFGIRADLGWSSEVVMQDEPVTIDVTFTGEDELLKNLNYDITILKGRRTVADLAQLPAKDNKAKYEYVFREPGLHMVQVQINGVGNGDTFIPLKKIFNYKIEVMRVDSPVKISTTQKGESLKIMVKNRDISSINLNSIAISLANVEQVDYKLPDTWTSTVNTEAMMIYFATEKDPLSAGETLVFTAKSKQFAKSLYNVCWDLEDSNLTIRIC
jgi:sugar lactone lactonase YvrE